MIIAVPFEPKHLTSMRVQPAQEKNVHLIKPEHLEFMARAGAWSGMVNGHAVVCGGVIVNGLGIGQLWSYLSQDAARYMVPITRFGFRLMTITPCRRIEATARVDFGAGCRWLAMLGFQVEGVMRRFDPDGSDHYLYSRLA